MGKHWTPKELKTLERFYPTKGVRGVARLLGRSEMAVAAKAYKECIAVGDVPGKLRLEVVAANTGIHRRWVRVVAERDGAVSTYTPEGGRKLVTLIDAAWAERYEKTVLGLRDLEAACADWYTYADLERIFACSNNKLRTALAGRNSLAQYLANVTIKKGFRTVFFNPWESERAVSAWRRDGMPPTPRPKVTRLQPAQPLQKAS